MTRYDPFAYGEVHLDPKQLQGEMPAQVDDECFAAGNSMQTEPSADSSWSLFDDDSDGLAPSVPSPSPSPSPSVQAEVDDFGGAIFGELPPIDHGLPDQAPTGGIPSQEVAVGFGESDAAPQELGLENEFADFSSQELGNEHHEPDLQSENASQLAPSLDTSARASEPGISHARQHREVRRRRPPAGTMAVPDALSQGTSKVRKTRIPGRRRRTALTVGLPILLCAGGGTVGSWFWVMQGNPVMASIIAAASIVSGLFARLFLRG